MIKSKKVPNPGTPEARDAGCTCPVMDNHYGRGYQGRPNVFVYTANCTLHGFAVKKAIVKNRKKVTSIERSKVLRMLKTLKKDKQHESIRRSRKVH